MELIKINIERFKGINNLEFNLSKSPHNNVYTFVGINESGKTTILEAINFFEYSNEKDILDTKINFDDIIPIKEKTNFNDSINIKSTLSLNDNDIIDLTQYIHDNSEYILTSRPNSIVITQNYQYKSSKYDKVTFFWNIDLKIRKKAGEKKSTYLDMINHSGLK